MVLGIKSPGIKCPFLGWGSKVRGSNVRGSNVHFGVGDQKSGDQMSILGSGIKRHQDQMSILCRGSNVLGIECPRDQLSTHFMGSKIRNQKSGDQKSGDQVSITHVPDWDWHKLRYALSSGEYPPQTIKWSSTNPAIDPILSFKMNSSSAVG